MADNHSNKHAHIKEQLNKEISLPRKIAIDILGVLLVIGSVLFGWLPGPGGVPLFIAGLSLLAVNHEWARKLLYSVKNNGMKIMDLIFKDHPLIALLIDIVAIAFLIFAGIFIGNASGNVIRGLAIALAFFGVGLFLGNRKRIYSINKFVTKIINKKP